MKEGWEYKKLGEVCDIERGGSPRPISDYITDAENGINWIKIGDAVEGSRYITSTAEKIKPEGMKKSRFVHKGDFILSNSMSFGKPYILGVDGCIHDGWLVIHDDSNTFNKDFLYYYLGSPTIYSEFKRLAVGGVVNNLNSNLVRGVRVAVPPLSEQQHIVEELDLLSGIIEKKKKQLKELDNLAESIFYDMFGDPITNEKGWKVKKLGEVYKLKSGDGLSAKQFVKGSHPVYGGNGISGYHNAYNLDGDFIIIGRVGVYCGNVRLVSGKFWLTDNAFQLFFDTNKQTPIFVEYMLTLLDLHQYANKAAQPVISNQTLKDVGVLYPPISLQQQFAEKVEAIEKQKELIKQSIKETETLFNSRMDYYFN